jgi:hypothetical protein
MLEWGGWFQTVRFDYENGHIHAHKNVQKI